MIKVRPATLLDVTNIMEFSARAYEKRSVTYRDLGFNSVIWRRTLKDALSDPSMVVLIAIDDVRKRITGILVGMKMPGPWFAGFCATDLVFVAIQGGDLLLREFVHWCAARKVRRIDMGVSEVGDLEAKDHLFGKEGFKQAGRVYYQVSEVKA